MQKLFEIALRNKIRFDTARGNIDLETLWDTPLESKDKFNLDEIALIIDSKINSTAKKSFVSDRTAADDESILKLEIVKHIIAVKIEEKHEATIASANKTRRNTLIAALANKEHEAVGNMTAEEIKAELAKL